MTVVEIAKKMTPRNVYFGGWSVQYGTAISVIFSKKLF